MTLIYIIAGEASGDVLGARLIAALRKARPDLNFAGIGGERMAEQGVPSLFPYRELALMGLLEVLPRIRQLRRRLAETEADILTRQPALLVTIDSPGFTLRIAEAVKPGGIPVMHYVAPQVWAWRPGRVKRLRHKIDHLLCLLPFEPAFFEAAGIPVTFVGHPVLESGVDQGNAARFRARHGLAATDRPLIIMPGSRRIEATRLLPIFGATLKAVLPQNAGLRPVIPVSPVVAPLVRAAAAQWPAAPILIEDLADKHDAFAAAAENGAGLIKSGTSSLEMAVAGVPHIVAYRLNPITAEIMRRLIKVPYASLVNLLCGREVVPERIHEGCSPEGLRKILLPLLQDQAAVAAQRQGFAETLAKLSAPQGTPSEAASKAVLAALP
ncbi:MAG: lipid-A-disaccharide synthase [Roseomonas sp.]|nr:lipid-A-disaccharide synthase [Roseomonas sp.]